jgi:acyl carrier protein
MDVRAKVTQTIRAVAVENNKEIGPVEDDGHLVEIGIDSLCMASVIAVLDDDLAVDPFGSGNDVMIPITVGDLIQVYQSAVRDAAAV